MLFSDLIQAVRLYVRVEGVDVEERIKQFINDACLEFPRKHEWNKLIYLDTFQTDGSGGPYIIDDIVQAPVANVILVNETGQDALAKKTYKEWITSASNSSAFTMMNEGLYVEGTGTTYNLLYTSCGAPYPMTDPDHENFAAKNYSDIIIQMAITRYTTFLGDDESSRIEYARLQGLLNDLKRLEAREAKSGRTLRLSSHNR